ncbi:MAG: tripartite tricarboxylate transporter TctB family protein [Pseudolabrys sp.]|nr:tripartite tricarboxylate transporter TctB family protein [Pseudolabrys sp.]
MNVRADHIAGAAFVLFGVAIIALSGDLPMGQLSMPGSGFLPIIVSVLTIFFGLMLVVGARESPLFSELTWSDDKHAVMVTVITGVSIAIYNYMGFVITMAAMMIALLVVIERRNPLRAAAYSLFIVFLTYGIFEFLLKTPLPASPFSY